MLALRTPRLLVVPLLALGGCNLISGADSVEVTDALHVGQGGTGGSAPTAMPLVDGVSIDQIAIYQGVKRPLMDHGAPASPALAFPVVENRDALVRVFYTVLSNYNLQPVTARLQIGTQAPIDVVSVLSGSSTDATLQSTINFEVPAAELTAGAGYRVDLMQSPALASGQNSFAQYPSQGLEALPIESSGAQVRIVLVPISYGGDGSNRLPDTSEAQLKRYHDEYYRLYPTAAVDISVGPQMDWGSTVDPDGTGWDDLLNGMMDFRTQSGAASDEYYFGVFAPAASMNNFCSGGCVAGLSPVAGPTDVYARAGVGLGFSGDDAAQTAVHETGHMHGLSHAPCSTNGPIDSVDPSYPYPNAAIGQWGYDLVSKALLSPTKYVDMMSYCQPIWISDYNFQLLFKRIRWVNGLGAQVLPPAGGEPVAYERISIGPDGRLTWRDPMLLALPPSGAPIVITATQGTGQVQIQGHFIAYGDLPGGLVLFPKPAQPITKVDFLLNTQRRAASRNDLTHRAFDY